MEVQPQQESKKPEKPQNPEDIEALTTIRERAIAALSYFGFLAIVPFYLEKDSKFCRFHGRQGMLLAIIFFLAQFITVLDIFMDLALILQAAIALLMGFAALSGKWRRMPFIYGWACQFEEAVSLKDKKEEAEAGQVNVN